MLLSFLARRVLPFRCTVHRHRPGLEAQSVALDHASRVFLLLWNIWRLAIFVMKLLALHDSANEQKNLSPRRHETRHLRL